jgi:hypothetical protein
MNILHFFVHFFKIMKCFINKAWLQQPFHTEATSDPKTNTLQFENENSVHFILDSCINSRPFQLF